MKKLKYVLYALAILLSITVALAAYVVLTFDPNKYKPQLISLVKDQKQRTLRLEGDIKFSFFPKLGIDLGKVSLSEKNSPQEFAAIDRLRLRMALLPLLKKAVVVDEIRIDGMRAKVIRHSDGTSNYDNLVEEKKDEKKVERQDTMPFAFDVTSVKITNSAFTLQDEEKGRTFAVSKLEVSTGRLGANTPTDVDVSFRMLSDKPKIDTVVHLTGGLTLDTRGNRSILKKLVVEVKGEASGITSLVMTIKGEVDSDGTAKTLSIDGVSAAMKGQRGTDNVTVTLDIPRLRLTRNKVSTEKIKLLAMISQPVGRLDVTVGIPALESTPTTFRAETVSLELNGTRGDNLIKGSITTPVNGNLEIQRFDLARIEGGIGVTNPKTPKGNMNMTLKGSARIDLNAEKIGLDLTTKLDESTITSKAGMEHFDTPYFSFDIGIDRIDVDHYLTPSPQGARKQQARTVEPEKPLDVSAIKTLRVDGNLRIGDLKAYNVKAANIRVGIKAADGKMIVSPMTASLYQGKVSGALTINTANTLQIAVQQEFKGVSIGPLIRDALNKDVLEGRGNVSFDVTGQGETVTAIKKALDGNLRIELRDGAIKGINIPGAIREAKVKLGILKGEQTNAASAVEQTDFSEMKALFTIRKGVAHDDLSAKSPLVRLTGAGNIDIGGEKLDYLLKATVVATLEGQAGKELAALRGVTVPVRISGPFAEPKVRLDFNSMVVEAVKQKVETITEEVKKKAEEALKERLKGLFR